MQRFEAEPLTIDCVKYQPGNTQIMEWFPIVFFTFKILVLGTGMFFAIKWHYDQGKKKKLNQRTVTPAQHTLDASDQSANIQ